MGVAVAGVFVVAVAVAVAGVSIVIGVVVAESFAVFANLSMRSFVSHKIVSKIVSSDAHFRQARQNLLTLTRQDEDAYVRSESAQRDAITYSAAISACLNGEQWQQALDTSSLHGCCKIVSRLVVRHGKVIIINGIRR